MKRPHKYRARAMICPDTGERFDSMSEYCRWRELKLLEMAGEISNLRRQVRYPFFIDGRPIKIRSDRYPNGRQVNIVMDFVYTENGETVTEDKKGFDTPVSRLKRGIFEAMHGREVKIT